MDFKNSLDRKMEEVERPPVLPVGHYICQVSKQPDLDMIESGKTGKQYDKLTFQMVTVSAHDDVDPDELEEFGDPSGQPLRKDFIFSKDEDDKAAYARSEYNLKRFLTDHLQLDESLSIGEALAESVGAQCLVEVKHRPDPENPEVVYTETGKTAAV